MRSADPIFTEEDLSQIDLRGMDVKNVTSQIHTFEKGIHFSRLSRPCLVGDGIVQVEEADINRLKTLYAKASGSGRSMKFTPASGAASRMFRLLLSFYSNDEDFAKDEIIHRAAKGEGDFKEFLEFLDDLGRFAFYDDLKEIMARDGLDIAALTSRCEYKTILEYLLTEKGLAYAALPKGLIKFHCYKDHVRTSLEEHLVGAAAYTKDRQGLCRLHFTVSPEHEEIILKYLDKVKKRYERNGISFDMSYSTQDISTDTIAVDVENRPFRDMEGRLLFRPAGHGALLKNLNDLAGDIIFIKNIDNVVSDSFKEVAFTYKEALGGYLIELQAEIFEILERLAAKDVDAELTAGAFEFMEDRLLIPVPDSVKNSGIDAQAAFILSKLNSPIRVCGMVKNEGEPGGGPFWVRGKDGADSLQIVEKSQVDVDSDEQRAMLEGATHFNPVDLVCGVRNYRGEHFDLMDYTDPDAGFISIKSSGGRQLKALELPGLWNGAMADWITIFVEVPISTFNPVKTVLDLLRREHQP